MKSVGSGSQNETTLQVQCQVLNSASLQLHVQGVFLETADTALYLISLSGILVCFSNQLIN